MAKTPMFVSMYRLVVTVDSDGESAAMSWETLFIGKPTQAEAVTTACEPARELLQLVKEWKPEVGKQDVMVANRHVGSVMLTLMEDRVVLLSPYRRGMSEAKAASAPTVPAAAVTKAPEPAPKKYPEHVPEQKLASRGTSKTSREAKK